MNHSTTWERALWSHCSQTGQSGLQQKSTGWRQAFSRAVRRAVNPCFHFLYGAAILCLLSTIQKWAIEAPFVLRGYIVPVGFGGLTGMILGHYISRLRALNASLRRRVGFLEALVPLCSKCNKTRKPDADPTRQDAWMPIEKYLSEQAGYRFTHSLCPDCMRALYPENADSTLDQIRSRPKE